ncbi:uncharacterized protein LY79DRAFT_61873 [Colletotrichum navitas]|uniref:Uncharacterized protein n=1 Tax=Colletotrichum navitas TaxID=681940 RepID=A0AAD8V7X8_9PEZI|nr:uncharacterized protein LY79DRAFT_61873 [Colletotrichum navitas]KAK1596344.1 hypothetical protein LY79DRAFT_61873 [Colletotrichum navitas]
MSGRAGGDTYKLSICFIPSPPERTCTTSGTHTPSRISHTNEQQANQAELYSKQGLPSSPRSVVGGPPPPTCVHYSRWGRHPPILGQSLARKWGGATQSPAPSWPTRVAPPLPLGPGGKRTPRNVGNLKRRQDDWFSSRSITQNHNIVSQRLMILAGRMSRTRWNDNIRPPRVCGANAVLEREEERMGFCVMP